MFSSLCSITDRLFPIPTRCTSASMNRSNNTSMKWAFSSLVPSLSKLSGSLTSPPISFFRFCLFSSRSFMYSFILSCFSFFSLC